MFRSDGTNGVVGIVPANLGAFTIALWFRTSSVATAGTLFGAVSGGQQISARLSFFQQGDLSVTMSQAGGSFAVTIPVGGGYLPSALNDGELHLLLIRRFGVNVEVIIDGVGYSPVPSSNTLPADDFAIGIPFGLCAIHQGGNTLRVRLDCDIAQWGLWDSFVGDLAPLICGEAFDSIEGIVEHWRAMDGNFEVPAAAASDLNGELLHEMMGLYALYSKRGTPPVPGVDVPIKFLPRDSTQAALAIAALRLKKNSRNYLGLSAIGLGGFSDLSLLSFPVDGSGHPVTVPSLVGGLRVTALAGGMVKVEWTYDELVALTLADEFAIAFESMQGQPAFADVIVTAVPPQQSYMRVVGPLTDGLWRVRVYSRYQGSYEANVTGVLVVADSVPPAVGISGIKVS